MEETLIGFVFIALAAWVFDRCFDDPYLKCALVSGCVVVAMLFLFGGLAGVLWGIPLSPLIAVVITVVLWVFFGIRPR